MTTSNLMFSLKKYNALNSDDVIDFAIKHVCNTQNCIYESISSCNYINDLYILARTTDSSIDKILSGYYHTNLGGGSREEDAKKLQETFPR